MTNSIQLKIKRRQINEAYWPYIKTDKRFNVFYGGGGSGKSVFVFQKMIIKLCQEQRKCLVVRKTAETLRESCFEEIKSQLSRFGFEQDVDYVATVSPMEIRLVNGSKFIFKGIDDPEKVKSISGIDDIIVEEATDITYADFQQLNTRLRSRKPNPQIHLMFNPVSKVNWVFKYWGFDEKTKAPPGSIVVHTTYKDNRFLTRDYVEQIEAWKQTDQVHYQVYALGRFASLDKLVYRKWKVEAFDIHEILGRDKMLSRFGLDYGYVNDPTAFIALACDEANKKLYVFDEVYQKGLLNNQIYAKIVSKGYTKERITADSAEQKSTEELRVLGLRRIRNAKKGPDSIRQGIQYLSQFDIIVHPDCVNTVTELENYAYKKDKSTGEYLNEPRDEFNHLMDAMRYAVEDLHKKPKSVQCYDSRKTYY